jgi:glycosyltransferase involved in cell wall biosynthesis
MRLLVVNPFALTPDRQDFYARVAERSGWDVHLAVPSSWRNDYGRLVHFEAMPQFPGRVTTMRTLLRGNIPLHVYAAHLRTLITEARPDVLYVYHEPYATATLQVMLANAIGPGVPIGFYSSQNIEKRYPPPFAQAERFVFRTADFAVAVSNSVASVLRNKGYTGPLHVIPFGVDTEVFTPGSRRARTGDGPMAIGYAGRLVAEKGVDVILRAVADLPRNDVSLTIVGDGPERPALEQLARDLGIDGVTWLGYLPHSDIPDFYRGLDVLVVPSRTTRRWKEQFGRVVIEAGACGTLVLTSDSGELPFVVEAAEAGETFREDDHQELAALLSKRVSAREVLGEEQDTAARTIAERFSVDVVVDQFIDVMRQSARRPG